MNDPTVGILHHDEGVDLVPANLELSAMEFNLVNAMSRETAFTLTKLDDLFSTQEQRDEEKLSKIRDIPLTEIDDFPDHPFKVRDDEDIY